MINKKIKKLDKQIMEIIFNEKLKNEKRVYDQGRDICSTKYILNQIYIVS